MCWWRKNVVKKFDVWRDEEKGFFEYVWEQKSGSSKMLNKVVKCLEEF